MTDSDRTGTDRTDRARKAALDVLIAFELERRPLDGILEPILSRAPLTRKDTTLLYAIVHGTLRWRNRIDHIINHFSRTRPDRVDPRIRNALRMGAFQMLYLDRVPQAAAVHSTVELAKAFSPAWTVKYVNAVLRNIGRRVGEVPFPDPERDPARWLAADRSFPLWMTRRWIARLGLEAATRMCDAHNAIAPLTLRANTSKTTPDALLERLGPAVQSARISDFCPEAIRLRGARAAVTDLPGFADGLFQVQDEAAQLVGWMVAPAPGERVLDVCAGLGGKTGHLAQLMNNQGRILALDRDHERLERLSGEMARLGVSIVSTGVHDLNRPPHGAQNRPSVDLGLFHRALVDAPCSGAGVLRRHPDGKWLNAEKDLALHHRRQVRFLENTAPLVRPGGRLIYAVCSTEPEENDAVVDAFLARHPEFSVIRKDGDIPPAAAPLVGEDGMMRTEPDITGMDGFFCARLLRRA